MDIEDRAPAIYRSPAAHKEDLFDERALKVEAARLDEWEVDGSPYAYCHVFSTKIGVIRIIKKIYDNHIAELRLEPCNTNFFTSISLDSDSPPQRETLPRSNGASIDELIESLTATPELKETKKIKNAKEREKALEKIMSSFPRSPRMGREYYDRTGITKHGICKITYDPGNRLLKKDAGVTIKLKNKHLIFAIDKDGKEILQVEDGNNKDRYEYVPKEKIPEYSPLLNEAIATFTAPESQHEELGDLIPANEPAPEGLITRIRNKIGF